jgi:hypothetical protein
VKGHGEKLSRKMLAAVAALLTEATQEQAAAKAGISISTMKRWRALPQFQRALRDARRDILEEVSNLYIRMAKRAALVAYESMGDDKPDPIRLRASEEVRAAMEKLVCFVDVRAELDELWAALRSKHEQPVFTRNGTTANGHSKRPGG